MTLRRRLQPRGRDLISQAARRETHRLEAEMLARKEIMPYLDESLQDRNVNRRRRLLWPVPCAEEASNCQISFICVHTF